MFYEIIRIKQGLSYILFCPLRILYNSKFIIMATYFGTNAVVVTRVHCTSIVANKDISQNSITEWQTVVSVSVCRAERVKLFRTVAYMKTNSSFACKSSGFIVYSQDILVYCGLYSFGFSVHMYMYTDSYVLSCSI